MHWHDIVFAVLVITSQSSHRQEVAHGMRCTASASPHLFVGQLPFGVLVFRAGCHLPTCSLPSSHTPPSPLSRYVCVCMSLTTIPHFHALTSRCSTPRVSIKSIRLLEPCPPSVPSPSPIPPTFPSLDQVRVQVPARPPSQVLHPPLPCRRHLLAGHHRDRVQPV